MSKNLSLLFHFWGGGGGGKQEKRSHSVQPSFSHGKTVSLTANACVHLNGVAGVNVLLHPPTLGISPLFLRRGLSLHPPRTSPGIPSPSVPPRRPPEPPVAFIARCCSLKDWNPPLHGVKSNQICGLKGGRGGRGEGRGGGTGT